MSRTLICVYGGADTVTVADTILGSRWVVGPGAFGSRAGKLAGRFPTVPSLVLLDLTSGIASGFDRTVYDSLYLALAVQSKVQLVTADEKLANALAAQLPVKCLGVM